MLHKPWHFTGIFVVVVFVASMFFGYYQCRYSENCTAPFVSVDSLSQGELQSKLIRSNDRLAELRNRIFERLQQKQATSIVRKSLDVVDDEEEVDVDTSLDLYAEQVPDEWFPSTVTVVSAGGNGVEKAHLDLIRLALYPFRDMLKDIHLTIYVGYKMDMYGKGIRAFASQYGKVMNIIAPTAYSFRLIPDREWIAILRHELAHVLHDQILNSSDRKYWEELVLKNGHVINEAMFSKYGGYDEYEALAEALIGLLFTDARKTREATDALEKMYAFLAEKFDIVNFDSMRDTYEFNSEKLPKDATRAFEKYPLPEFVI